MSRFEKLYILITICLAAGVSLANTDEGDSAIKNNFDAIALVGQMVVYSLLFFFCFVHRRIVMQHLRQLAFPLPLALLAIASSAWSILPGLTFRRSIFLLFATFFAYYLGAMMDPAALSKMYLRAIGLMVILSVLVILLIPSHGISHGAHAGAWRGAFSHKNRFGEIMALAVITFGISPPEYIPKLRRWAFVAVSLVLLYKAHNSTALIAVPAILLAQAVWYFFKIRRKALSGILLVGYPFVFVAIAGIAAFSNSLFKLVGKDATFSGRDRLWAGVLDAISVRPLLGWGYLAFWLQQGGSLILIDEKTTFSTIHAHNGFLNLLLHLGFVGLALFLVFFFRTVWIVIREGRRTNSPQSRWFYSFILFFVIANLTESEIIEVYYFMWITLIAFYTSFVIQRSQRYDQIESNIETTLHEPQLSPAIS